VLQVDHTLASIVALALFISAGLILFLALWVRSLRREKYELESSLARLDEDYRLLRAATPFPYTRNPGEED